MTINIERIVSAAILASTLVGVAEGFAPIMPRRHISGITRNDGSSLAFSTASRGVGAYALNSKPNLPLIRQTKLCMAGQNNSEGPGLVTKIFISFVLLFFLISLFAPLLDFAFNGSPATDPRLGDSVVTREDDGNSKLKNYQSKRDALSLAKIQEKLSNLPVFYLSANDGTSMGDKIYLSFNEAETAAKPSQTVKATTLDQVMYPLVLKREAAKTTKTAPVEIRNARESVERDGESSPSYALVPSAAARSDAKGMSLRVGDVPLFVAERLAFASDDGRPRVPLFAERGDAVESYARLRGAGSGKLPEVPTIRTTSLMDVLESMEGGTRPAVGQLELYGNADDVMKADEMSR